MIIKTNQKGLTVIELLICFTLVSVITIAMFKTINSYKSKEDEESFKNSITTYKTVLTKEIYEDIINHKGITNVVTTQTGGAAITNELEAYKTLNFVYQTTLSFQDGTTRNINIVNSTKCYTSKRNSEGKREFEYGVECQCFRLDSDGDCEDGNELNLDMKNSEFYIKYGDEKFELPKIDGLKYNAVTSDEKQNGFITIHIGLWHNDYGTGYDALNIVLPNVSKYPEMFS